MKLRPSARSQASLLVVLLVACASLLAQREGAAGRAVAEVGALVDQQGRPFAFEALRGRTTLVNFVFTHCTSVCPIQTQVLRRVQRELPAALAERVAFVSVTLDPENDTPEVLAHFAELLDVDTTNWWFVTGPPEATAAVAQRFRADARPSDDGAIDHRAAVHLLDADGRVVQTYSGASPDPERLVREIGDVDRLFARD